MMSIRLTLPVRVLVAGIAVAIMLGTGMSVLDAAVPDSRPLPQPDGLILGAYDPSGDFVTDPDSRIEHLFLPWEDVDLSTLRAADTFAIEHGRTLLITIEPWTWSQDRNVTADQLRDGIAAGRYDGNIAAICSIVAKFQTPTTIRWGHEMEDTTGRFTWANWRPADYIAAYRHVIQTCRSYAPNVAFMWSPKGEPSLVSYYPGDDVVDVIGLSVFGLQAYDRLKEDRDLSFGEIVATGYEAAQRFGKPIYVAELGYSGDEAYVRRWQSDVLKARAQFPLLKGVIYFNDRDMVAWPGDLGVPDWRVSSNIVASN